MQQPQPQPQPQMMSPCQGEVATIEAGAASRPLDPGEHALMLKKKLLIYCTAVANANSNSNSNSISISKSTLSSGSYSSVAHQQSSSSADPNSCNKPASPLGFQPSANGSVPNGGLAHLPTQNSGVGGKLAHSCSSKELSDENEEEDLEGDNETTDSMDPANVKRMRRMLSNRESARRSRKRKQAHLNDLEAEVSQLRVENSSLLKHLSDMTQKYNDASVDKRVLKADIETLQAKVKMAEDTVKRVTGTGDELCSSNSDISALTIPFYLTPPDEISDAAVPAKDVTNLFGEPNNKFISPSDIDPTDLVINRTSRKMGKARKGHSLQRVASLECLQKRICGGPGSCVPNQWDAIIPESS